MRLFCLILLAFSAAHVSAAPPADVERFVKRGAYLDLALSPDGEHLAAVYELADRTAMVLIRRADMQPVARHLGAAGSAVGSFFWLDSARLIVEPAEQFGELDTPRATGELVLLNTNGDAHLVFDRSNGKREGSDAQVLRQEAPHTAQLIDRLASDPESVLIGVREWTTATPYTEIQKLFLDSRRRRGLMRTPVKAAHVVADATGEPRLSFGYKETHASFLYHRRSGDKDWTLVNDESSSGHSESPLGFSPGGTLVYLQSTQAEGPDLVLAWNPDTGARSEIARDARLDPGQILRDGSGAVIGVAYLGERRRVEYFDSEHVDARLHAVLKNTFPADDVYLHPAEASATVRLFEVRSDRDPGSFFLFDVAAKRAAFLMRRLPEIEPLEMATSVMVDIPARDGLLLQAVLTRPKNMLEGEPLPTVVLPHGGPYGLFDRPDFNPEVQAYAAAGFAVLQVNFRGSGNYGFAFQAAGARQWGRAMQDDITDATRWALEEGIALRGKVCLVGASYGAYVALMGVAREAGLYACAVGAFGVYDLIDMARENRQAGRLTASWSADWVGSVDALEAVSPTQLAHAVHAPVLLVAGREDPIAPLAHSQKMQRALKRSGASVQHWYVKGAGHGFHSLEHRREYLQRVLAFLHEHLRSVADGEDAAGAG